MLTEDLLRMLRGSGAYDRWLNVYLSIVYAHPTNDLVAAYSRTAVEFAAHVGRQAEVFHALSHVKDIPLDFNGKSQLQGIAVEHSRIASAPANTNTNMSSQCMEARL